MAAAACLGSQAVKLPKQLPIALTIAGSDSGGGAGIQADLKTFASLGVHGTSAITCITAQNPREVTAVQACRPAIVRQQVEAVFSELPPKAVKTGMLYSRTIMAEVIRTLANYPDTPLVVDPVMVSTSGAKLLRDDALKYLCSHILPRCLLVTPNLDEAQLLTGSRLAAVEDLRQAARALHQTYGCAALVKGGHLRGLKEAVDIFYDGEQELLLSAPFVRGVSTHGTGCTYSAAITGFLALGLTPAGAVVKAKEYISQAIAQAQRTAGHTTLNSFWQRR